MISINGFEEENDTFRGKGTFQKIMASMDILRKFSLLFGVSLTVTSKNINTMMDIDFYDCLISKGVKLGWSFHYMPVGRDPSLDLMISYEQRKELGQFIYKLRNSRPIFIADFWNDGFLVGGCMAGGKHYLHITNKGEVEPCVFCHFAIDNIKEKSLHQVIQSPFFMDIKKEIPYEGNMLRPCMLIDRPEVFIKHYFKHFPNPTHNGAVTFVTNLSHFLQKRSKAGEYLLNKAWENKEYCGLYTMDPKYYNAIP